MSTEEIGNPVYPPARLELQRHGINMLPIIEQLGLIFQCGENVATWFSILLY